MLYNYLLSFIENKNDIITFFVHSKNILILHLSQSSNKLERIASDLYIAGLGGSTPILEGGKFEIGQIPVKDLDFQKEMYAGYPYNYDDSKENYVKSDQMLLKDLKDTIDTMKKQAGDPYYILLSHCGPLYCLTNYMVLQGENLYLRSEQLGKVFWEESKCFLNIHGHTH